MYINGDHHGCPRNSYKLLIVAGKLRHATGEQLEVVLISEKEHFSQDYSINQAITKALTFVGTQDIASVHVNGAN